MGTIRGKRNRDSDRYWHERRKAEQGGMVGALDVPCCCFCGHLVAPIDALWNDFGDAYCRSCGIERGLVNEILTRDRQVLSDLESMDALAYSEGVTGKSGRQHAAISGYVVFTPHQARTGESYRRSRTLERFEREASEAALAEQRRQERLNRRVAWLSASRVAARRRHVERQARQRAVVVFLSDLRAADRIRQREMWHVIAAKHRKLTDSQALTIRERYKRGGESFARLGAEFGVTGAAISACVSGGTYKHVGGPIHAPRWRSSMPWLCNAYVESRSDLGG